MSRVHRPLVASQREGALKHALIYLSRRLVISCGYQHVCLLKVVKLASSSPSSGPTSLAYLLLAHIYYIGRALSQPSRVDLLHALAFKVVMTVAHTVNGQVPLYRSLCVSIRSQAVAHLPLLSVGIRHCSRLMMLAGAVIQLGKVMAALFKNHLIVHALEVG